MGVSTRERVGATFVFASVALLTKQRVKCRITILRFGDLDRRVRVLTTLALDSTRPVCFLAVPSWFLALFYLLWDTRLVFVTLSPTHAAGLAASLLEGIRPPPEIYRPTMSWSTHAEDVCNHCCLLCSSKTTGC